MRRFNPNLRLVHKVLVPDPHKMQEVHRSHWSEMEHMHHQKRVHRPHKFWVWNTK